MKSPITENLQNLNFSSTDFDKLKEIYDYPEKGFITITDAIDRIFCCYIEVCINSGENITIDGIDVQYFRDTKIVLEILHASFKNLTPKN